MLNAIADWLDRRNIARENAFVARSQAEQRQFLADLDDNPERAIAYLHREFGHQADDLIAMVRTHDQPEGAQR